MAKFKTFEELKSFLSQFREYEVNEAILEYLEESNQFDRKLLRSLTCGVYDAKTIIKQARRGELSQVTPCDVLDALDVGDFVITHELLISSICTELNTQNIIFV